MTSSGITLDIQAGAPSLPFTQRHLAIYAHQSASAWLKLLLILDRGEMGWEKERGKKGCFPPVIGARGEAEEEAPHSNTDSLGSYSTYSFVAKGVVGGGTGGGGAWVCWLTTIGAMVSGALCGVSTRRTSLPHIGAWVPTSTAEAEGRAGGGGEKGQGHAHSAGREQRLV